MTDNLLQSVKMLGFIFLALAIIPISYCRCTALNKVIAAIWEHDMIYSSKLNTKNIISSLY